MSEPGAPLTVDLTVPGRPRTVGWPGRVIRGCAIVVLLLAGLTIVGSAMPGWRSTRDLTADLAAGRVTYLRYSSDTHTVRWVDDWVLWRQAPLQLPFPGPAGVYGAGQEADWLRGQVAASGHPVNLALRSTGGSKPWPFQVPWLPLRAAAIGVWTLALIHMLSRGGHRVANRWAWFWLFFIGQAGVILYLIREPVPIWRRELPATDRQPTKGGTGFAQAVLLSLGTGLLGLGVAELLR
jgi:hypothetical protein